MWNLYLSKSGRYPIDVHVLSGIPPICFPPLIRMRNSGQRSKQGTTHQDVDIRGSEQPSSQLPQTHLHPPPSTGWIWGDQRKVISAQTQHYTHTSCKKRDTERKKWFMCHQKARMICRVCVPYLCRSVCPFSICISRRACSLPTPGMPLWMDDNAEVIHTSDFDFAYFRLRLTPYLGNIITAKEDGQTDEVLSGEL